MIAEVISWFDVTAVQECKEDHRQLRQIVERLGGAFRFLCSDASGNNERLAFIYDAARLQPIEEIGEIAFPASRLAAIRLKGIEARFAGFDRTPYLVNFRIGDGTIVLVNVHLYYGSEAQADVERRALEALAVAKWADARRRSHFSFTRQLAVLGDFNMPKAVKGSLLMDALTTYGLMLPEHSSSMGSSIMSDVHYDQVALFPGERDVLVIGRGGVFDFDAVAYPELYGQGSREEGIRFRAYWRYHLSDHRPMWVEVQCDGE